MTVIGGTYSEICFEPIWENIYGSGFRAVNLFLEIDKSESIKFHTCSDNNVKKHLMYYEGLYPNLSIHATEVLESPLFHYDHPLKTPVISPRPDLFDSSETVIEAEDENILVYGLLEASVRVNGRKVVYDPQSPANPKSFRSTGSAANQLVTIVNFSEAKTLVGSEDMRKIVDFFFEKEGCFALIVKMGAHGALLYESQSEPPKKIPVFITRRVWPIGSGDVFSAYFAHHWFNGGTLHDSALLASKATANYCNSKDLASCNTLDSFEFAELLLEESPKGQVYLAGPFFTYPERWFVNEAWTTLRSFGLKVFSPFHDVGHGKAKDVVDKDLEGLNASDIVFAIIDGLDPGTLFEVGYAISKNKKVVAFVQKEGEESLKMLEGTECIITKDFTTAIYKTYWALAS
ncbi:PfkB family carbohydrate kinase [Ekhidna sp.]|uniref:PfkB family carbohydrate kinase n=1 Tax=Ekhidna sp. TaxID=2608089 RepID=UPI003CCBD6EA